MKIELNEQKLNYIIKESVRKVLNELDWRTLHNARMKAMKKEHEAIKNNVTKEIEKRRKQKENFSKGRKEKLQTQYTNTQDKENDLNNFYNGNTSYNKNAHKWENINNYNISQEAKSLLNDISNLIDNLTNHKSYKELQLKLKQLKDKIKLLNPNNKTINEGISLSNNTLYAKVESKLAYLVRLMEKELFEIINSNDNDELKEKNIRELLKQTRYALQNAITPLFRRLAGCYDIKDDMMDFHYPNDI